MSQARILDGLSIIRRHPAWTAVAGLFVALALFLMLFDWNWAKGPVQRVVSSFTQREFRIDGDLDVDFIPLEISAEGLYFGNADWATDAAMATAARLDARVRFSAFVRRPPNAPASRGGSTLPAHRTQRRRPRQLGCSVSRGVARRAGALPGCDILGLHATQGRFELREPALQTALDVRFDSAAPTSKDTLAPLVLSGKGTYRNAPFTLQGQVDSPLALQGKPLPYRLDLRAQAGDTHARASGTLAEPLQTQNVAVHFELRGADLAQLYELTGVVLPESPPYDLKGTLTREGNIFSYRDFAGTVGDSDLAGNASMDIGGPRPKLAAKLTSKVIDFDDLAGFIGGNPGTGDGETASEEQRKAAAAKRATGKLLPSTPIEFGKLRAMDADVQLVAARVHSRRLPLESMTAHLVPEDGLLTLEPLDFAAAGGRLTSRVRVRRARRARRFRDRHEHPPGAAAEAVAEGQGAAGFARQHQWPRETGRQQETPRPASSPTPMAS